MATRRGHHGYQEEGAVSAAAGMRQNTDVCAPGPTEAVEAGQAALVARASEAPGAPLPGVPGAAAGRVRVSVSVVW